MAAAGGRSRVRSLAQLSALAIISPLAGLLAEIVLAAVFGSSHVVDAFRIAILIIVLGNQLFLGMMLPNLLIPLVSSERTRGTEQQAWQAAFTIGYVLIGICLFLTGAVLLAPGTVVDLLGPGLSLPAHRAAEDMVSLFAVVFLGMAFTGTANAILQASGVFWTGASTQVAVNLLLCTVVWFLGQRLGGWAISLSITGGAVFGIVLHGVLVQSLASASEFSLRGALMPRWSPALTGALLRMGPIIGVLLVGQWYIIIANRYLSTLPEGVLANWGYAFKLTVILVVVPNSLITVLFPELAKAATDRNGDRARALATRSLRMIVTLALLASIILYTCRYEVVDVLLGRGALRQRDVVEIASILGALCWLAPPSVVLGFLAKLNYAGLKSLEPLVQVAFIAAAVTLVGGYAVTRGGYGMAAAITAVHAVAAAGHLAYVAFVSRRLDVAGLCDFVPRIAAISAIGLTGTLWLHDVVIAWLGATTLAQLAVLGVTATGGGLLVLLVARLVRLPELDMLLSHGRAALAGLVRRLRRVR